MYSAITIGKFDGFHRGHKQILETLDKVAKERGLQKTLVSFNFTPSANPVKLINTYEEKREFLEQFSIDNYIEYPFTDEFKQMPAEDFVKNIILDELKGKLLIVGEDYRFGRNREGDVDLLRRMGLEVVLVPSFDENGEKISSSSIRKAISEGDIALANKYLGHNYFINLLATENSEHFLIPKNKLVPPDGKYITLVSKNKVEFIK